ncbi:Gfo/Idh/MocA family protein (plasmid) [Haloarcula salina]|uniref:Gfo/Idh/MocA family protein n=1 Tax=Haloarcula salina TaxID=1429914 RepID=UPI003C6ED173
MRSASSGVAVGVVGVGSLGHRLARQFAELEGADLVALADVSHDLLTEVSRNVGVPPESLYRDYEEMLDVADLDAVGIATPNGLHYEQVIAALERDLHVLCEKPLATNVREAWDLTQRARDYDPVVMVGYQRHLNPAYDMARDRWAEGDREPTFITGEITHDWDPNYEDGDGWRTDPSLSGGGHLINVGTHVVDAILWTTGLTPTHVTASVDFHDEAQIFDRQSSITVEFENGALANISDTARAARAREHVHIWDEQGAVYLEGREWDERTGYTIDADGTEHRPYQGYSRWLSKGTAFLDAIETGEEPPCTVEDGLKAAVVTMAAYESGRRRERVTIADLYPFLEDVF